VIVARITNCSESAHAVQLVRTLATGVITLATAYVALGLLGGIVLYVAGYIYKISRSSSGSRESRPSPICTLRVSRTFSCSR